MSNLRELGNALHHRKKTSWIFSFSNHEKGKDTILDFQPGIEEVDQSWICLLLFLSLDSNPGDKDFLFIIIFGFNSLQALNEINQEVQTSEWESIS